MFFVNLEENILQINWSFLGFFALTSYRADDIKEQ